MNTKIDKEIQEKVLLAVIKALYFDDSSDYKRTLEYVFHTLNPDLYDEFLKTPRDVLKQQCLKFGLDLDGN